MKMIEKIPILDIPISKLTLSQVLETATDYLKQPACHMIFTPNSEMLMVAQKDPELKMVLQQGDVVVPDGIGVVIASRLLGHGLPERVTGFDIMQSFLDMGNQHNYSVYFLGGKPGITDIMVEKIQKRYPHLKICGHYHGYFDAKEENAILEEINQLKPDFLFVALGMGKQEKWIYANREKVNSHIAIGVGGSFDVLAGKVKRAPAFFQKAGLEWFYRLVQEPWRYKRMMALPYFILKVLQQRE